MNPKAKVNAQMYICAEAEAQKVRLCAIVYVEQIMHKAVLRRFDTELKTILLCTRFYSAFYVTRLDFNSFTKSIFLNLTREGFFFYLEDHQGNRIQCLNLTSNLRLPSLKRESSTKSFLRAIYSTLIAPWHFFLKRKQNYKGEWNEHPNLDIAFSMSS